MSSLDSENACGCLVDDIPPHNLPLQASFSPGIRTWSVATDLSLSPA